MSDSGYVFYPVVPPAPRVRFGLYKKQEDGGYTLVRELKLLNIGQTKFPTTQQFADAPITIGPDEVVMCLLEGRAEYAFGPGVIGGNQ